MAAGTRSRFTIGQGMVGVAAVAVALGVVLTPGVAPVLGMVVIPSTVAGLSAYLAARGLIGLVYGLRCPGCGARGLERRALVSFGDRFYLCPSCGARCRRGRIGASAMFAWQDASGPEFVPFYEKPQVADPWNAPPGLEDEDERGVFSKTHMNLVRSKRRRSPDDPNGPGLE